jgi:hypothetical protein
LHIWRNATWSGQLRIVTRFDCLWFDNSTFTVFVFVDSVASMSCTNVRHSGHSAAPTVGKRRVAPSGHHATLWSSKKVSNSVECVTAPFRRCVWTIAARVIVLEQQLVRSYCACSNRLILRSKSRTFEVYESEGTNEYRLRDLTMKCRNRSRRRNNWHEKVPSGGAEWRSAVLATAAVAARCMIATVVRSM